MVEKDHFGNDFSSYKIGDLHTHTSYSQGSLVLDGTLLPQQVVEKAVERGLSFLAITDHDTVASSFVGKEHALMEGYDIDVITGAEVSSSEGHILALGIETNIPFWMSARETVKAIHKAGGLAVAAHPFFRLTDSVGGHILREIADDGDDLISWDGIEVFNAGVNDWRFAERIRWMWQRDGNRKARNFYSDEGGSGLYGAAVAGSDAHNEGVGRAVTTIPDTMDIFTAIKERSTGVKMMDEKEGYTFNTMRETKIKSTLLERTREAMSPEKRIFPLWEASSQ